jgi:hypothetical protein
MNKVTICLDNIIIFDKYQNQLNKIYIQTGYFNYTLSCDPDIQDHMTFKFKIIENDEIIYDEYINFYKLMVESKENYDDTKYPDNHPFPLSSYVPLILKNDNYEINLGLRNLYKQYDEFQISQISYKKLN